MELKRFNNMVKERKEARKSKISEPVGGSSDLGGIDPLLTGDIS